MKDLTPRTPEHRIAYHPTTAKVFDRFDGLSLYQLKQNGVVKTLRDDLSDLQKNIIEILEISEHEFWSEDQDLKVGNNEFFMCGK